MILLEDGLPGPWPIVQVIFKSYLPSKKINLFRTTAQHFFWALQELTNPMPLIFTQILLLHQRGAWISMMIRKLVKMGWLWMDFIKTTTQQHKLSQRKEIVMNCSYLSLMTMMILMEWTNLIPHQVMKDSKLRCIYMTNYCQLLSCLKRYAPVNSICTLPPPFPGHSDAFFCLVSPGCGALANFGAFTPTRPKSVPLPKNNRKKIPMLILPRLLATAFFAHWLFASKFGIQSLYKPCSSL